ncbi:hypothetical protein LBMAG51_06770 [Phycisphaerae bacterium]|nr:hypothetical protein LBMAG51_06770 [Phycisphaerae bacterium]
MLRTRLIVGSLLIAGLAAIAIIDSSSPTAWIGFMRLGPGAILVLLSLFAFAPILAGEFSRLMHPKEDRKNAPLYFLAIFVGIASIGVLGDALPRHLVMPVVMTGPFFLVIACAINHARTRLTTGFANLAGGVLLAYAAIGVPLGFWILLRHDRDAWTLAGAILCVKSADIGAYFTGISIGRHKMIPWLSPGKSWEGFFGGVVLSALVGAGLAALSSSDAAINAFVDPVSIGYGAFVAVLLGIVGTGGDLFESLLKRGAGVKDSGTILPGMGGLYDVFDSLLLAGPLAWWMLAN